MKRCRLKSRSTKRRSDENRYSKAKAEHFKEHPNCAWPQCTRSVRKGHELDIHHKAGRNGPLLYERRYFCTLCRRHHDYVESHLSWARANGWIVDLSSQEVWEMKQREILET